MRIIVDVDNTLNCLSDYFIYTIEKMGYTYDISKYTTYNVEYGIDVAPEKQLKLRDKIFNSKKFWSSIPILHNAYQGLHYLNNYHKVIIATVPWIFNEDHKQWKTEWILEHFLFITLNQILFVKNKWELDADVIIEDKEETLQKCYDKGMITIVVNQVYNRNLIDFDYRMCDWKEIKKIMKEIEGEKFEFRKL